jgi:hypothetical protein
MRRLSLAEPVRDQRDQAEQPEHRSHIVQSSARKLYSFDHRLLGDDLSGMGMSTQARADVQHQRSFHITNCLIVIRRQVMWSSIVLE